MILHEQELLHAYLRETGILPRFRMLCECIKVYDDEQKSVKNLLGRIDPDLEPEQIDRIWTMYLVDTGRDASNEQERNEI